MIRVTVGNNLSRTNVIVSEDTTLKQVLTDNGIDYSRGGLTLDGASLKPGDIDKTFAAIGVTESCYLLQVVKADNA